MASSLADWCPASYDRQLRQCVECPACGQVQYVPPLAALLAGLVTAEDVSPGTIASFDSRVKTSGPKVAIAHPFDVSTKEVSGLPAGCWVFVQE